MTETGTSTINPTRPANRIGSIGQLAPGFTASIRDDDGAEVPAGTTGRLWIKSPSNMIGYWNRPDATAETIVDGWLDTGDLVAADEQNYLWFRGRKKQIIIHDGSNICPQEVEESLLEHPAVASAGVIGVHDLIHGENVRAYITLRPDAERPTTAELIQFSRPASATKRPTRSSCSTRCRRRRRQGGPRGAEADGGRGGQSSLDLMRGLLPAKRGAG